MIEDAALDRALEAWLRSADPGQMDISLVDEALAMARTLKQRGRFALAVVGPTAWPSSRRFGNHPPAQWIGAALGAAVFLVVVVSVGGLLPSPNAAAPLPHATASSTATASDAPAGSPLPVEPSASIPVAPVDVEDQGPSSEASHHEFNFPRGVRLTSRRFGLPITFEAPVSDADGPLVGPANESDWCWAETSERSIVIPFKYGCVLELRVLWPSEVQCGSSPVDLTVDGFAEAVLANPALRGQDLGVLEDQPRSLKSLLNSSTGRVLFIPGNAAYHPTDCVIRSGETIDELRGDLYSLLIVLNVDGQLVVVRWGPGHDAASAADARARGYQGVPLDYRQLDYIRLWLGE